MDFNRDSYRAQVARVFEGLDRETVFNGTLEHACIVTEEAFRAAKSHVRILSNKLDTACYGATPVLEAALEFVSQPEVRLDVLIEDGVSASVGRNIFLKSLYEAGGEKVRVAIVPEETVSRYKFNFLSLDGSGYRFESDRANPIAVVGNEPATAVHLARLFDDLWAYSRQQPAAAAA